MSNNIYPITYDKNHYTVVANDIVRGKQNMTLQEARIIRLLVTQVVKEDKDLKTYTCKIQDLAKFLEIPSQNLYRDIKKICNNLMDQKINIGTGNPKDSWQIFRWMQLAKYDGNGNLTLMLSNQIKDYVVELEKYFTQYQFKEILQMNSFYSIRLYELLKCEEGYYHQSKNTFEFSVEKLREYFNCDGKYKKINHFTTRIIKPAIKEINKYTDIWVDVEYIRTGQTIDSIRFILHDGEYRRSRIST